MFDFIFCLLEVEVVEEFVGFAAGIEEVDFELEFAPAVFGDAEGRLFEDCTQTLTSHVLVCACWIDGGRVG